MAAWDREPTLAAALRDAAAPHLVLDAADGRVRRASPAAGRLAEALALLDGRSITRQLTVAFPADGPPRLVRLRLDPRRIVPPSLFLVARGQDDDGHAIFLAIPSGPTALPRLPAVAPTATVPHGEPAEAPPAPPPAEDDGIPPGHRFLWRSDEQDTLTSVSGPLAALVGRAVSDFGGPVADALAARRTFRKVPARILLSPRSIEADLSGAPAGRDGAVFRGFEGFGVVRATGPERGAPVSEPEPEPRAEVEPDRSESTAVSSEIEATPAPADALAGHDAPLDAVLREIVEGDPAPVEPDVQDADGEEADRGDANYEDPDFEEGERTEAPTADASLSSAEHDAFREIARALGARYAGDEETKPFEYEADRNAGSVTPFPVARAEAQDIAPPPETDTSGLLDGLPIAALVHRGEAIIAVNRPFLDLTGYADADALRLAGMDAVFPGGAPNFRSGLTHETAITLAEGGSCPVEVTRGICAWEGGPAAILILRRLEEDDPRRALAAERLAREVQAGRALGAEAALDALQAGVVTVDRDGRVVTLNRAAASLFGANATEVVGAGLASLFDNGSAIALASALAGEGDVPGVVLAQGRAMMLALAPPRADGHRVAVLHRLPDSIANPPTAEPAPRRAPSPLRLDRELREPIDAILALTHTMLEERFGTLGDQRYRACLADIREAGVRILERVSELSDLAAVEAGQIDLHPRPLALNEVVANCVAVLQGEAARSRIVLRTSFSANLAELEVDEPSVRRAASLVIEQAIRRSVAGGQVIVSTGAGEAAEVALRVRDGGPAQEVAQAGAAEEDLRLALPRALVQANGGQLRLRGRGEDGTLVEIVLPVRRSAQN
ncbi:Cell-division control histidine kinase PdhS [Methylobacterium aerolatum]|nr:Cell-division control histidine kinase PdhS [Methylobacterium aerolatum]